MRILSWNINGIRTLPKYHPWNSHDSCEGILDALGAEIICFQEMKSSRAMLSRDVALPGPYHASFSFPVNKGGYSGVAVYTDSRKVVPLKAEEGLTGILQPKPPLSSEERVSPDYPRAHHIDVYPETNDEVDCRFEALDVEGRTLVLDFGLFVLINVYCPAETSDARLPFKMNFHYLLQERVRKLIEEEHREVIVIGDINVSATPLDHGDGHLASSAATFWDHPARDWFRKWLYPDGPMVDVIRSFWPDRKGLYTCWNTKLQARETNYGARIDYILVTRGLLPWVKHGDIQASLKGSDHCPIYIDLHEELVMESGATVTLRDAMRQHDVKEPPRLSAKYWEEFSGKQTVLSSFFGKRSDASTRSDIDTQSMSPSDAEAAFSASPSRRSLASPSMSAIRADTQPSTSQNTSNSDSKSKSLRPTPTTSSIKRKPSDKGSAGASKKKKLEPGQANISSFFAKPSLSKSLSQEVIILDDEHDVEGSAIPSSSPGERQAVVDPNAALDADYLLACELSSQADAVAHSDASSSTQKQSKSAWSNLFAPLQPPKCTVHGEPAKLFTVNKQGPNKGKTFYICSRPVGPGYDKGKSERLREEVNHEYRCNYFKWASDVKREALQGQQSKNSSDNR